MNHRAFYRNQQAWGRVSEDDYHDLMADVRTAVSCWTENTMLEGTFPSLDGFLEHYQEYDHSDLFEVIEAEITRIREIVELEQQEAALYEDGGAQPEISAFPCW